MALPLTVNGAVFEYPQDFDNEWGVDATGWAQAVTNGMLQKAGGSFPLTAQVDFGTSFGIKVKSLLTETVNPSSSGYIALAKTDTIGWRNNANSANLLLAVDASDMLMFNGVVLGLTSLTQNHIFVGNASNQPTDVAMSADATIVASGALTIAAGAINNAKVAPGAAIAVNKLAALTASRAAALDSSGFLVASATTAVELGYVSGVTSAIQTQINAVQQVPSGAMMDFGGTVPPTGWLVCDGSAISRTTYAALFTAIGVLWGVGDGSTTFNIPSMSRRTTMGAGGSGSATIGNTVGNVGGEETHTLITAEIPAHSHTANVSDPGHTHVSKSDATTINRLAAVAGGSASQMAHGNGGGAEVYSIGSSTTGIGVSTNNTGGDGAHNNVQPAAIVLKIIKT